MPRYESLETRFYRHVYQCPVSGCHIWGGSGSAKYGQIWVDGKLQATHRIAWILAGKNIPHGLFVLHKCDNGFCVNIAHLFLGSQSDNMQDCSNKGRLNCENRKLSDVCKRGHKYTEYGYKRKDGRIARQCKECRRVADFRRRHRDALAAWEGVRG
jgi:hypothetical protein